MIRPFTFQDISETLPPELIAAVEPSPDNLHLQQWERDGVVILRDFIPHALLESYERCWWSHNGATRLGGWPDCTPYMRHHEVRQLSAYSPLANVMASLIGEPAAVHLNLTGFVSTQRKWHQDTYLNPPNVGTFYIAAWFALEDIHPEAGPFEYVPGSHKWPVIRRDKLFQFISSAMAVDPRWPSLTQDDVARAIESEIRARQGRVVTYLPKRGDILLWHSNLVHRGSRPQHPSMLRKAFIAHYSGIHHRPDFPRAVKYTESGWYFPIQETVPVR